MAMFYRCMLLVAVVMASCAKGGDPMDGPTGDVQLGVTTDVRADVYRVSTRGLESDPTYRLTIFKGTKVVATYDDYTTAGTLKLPQGSYKFVVESGTNQSVAVDAPYFRGEQMVKIVAGDTLDVDMQAKLANVRLSVEFSQLIKDNFKDYSFKVRDVTLTKAQIDRGVSLFVSADVPEFSWQLAMMNNQNVEAGFSQVVIDVEPCRHYRFMFDIDNSAGAEDGSAILNLTVFTEVDRIEHDIDISLENKPLPTFVYQDGSLTLGEQVVVNELTRGANLKVNMTSEGTLSSLRVRHASAALDLIGFPRLIKPVEMSLEQIGVIAAKGVSFSALGGTASSWVDFSALAATAPLGEYRFYVTVEDVQGQSVDCVVDFVVLPDQDHFTKSPEVGAKYAVFNGEWCTLVVPDGLTFQYRKASEGSWIDVPQDQVKMGNGKAFSARVIGLEPLTKYVVRTYSPAAGEKQGQHLEFTTFGAPDIPNLRFDEGYWGGNNWYPNASGGNSYWATGNEGVTQGIVGMSANNVGTDDAVSGKALKMTSVPINLGVSPVKFAAGSVFTGTYSTDMSNPANSPKFGRPYIGRPLALKGWFKYKPVNINNDKNGVTGDQWGKLDKCHIYISLEDWAGATSRPGSPRIIGYGEFKTDRTVTSYEEFYIKVDYNDPTRLPTHVVVAATASHFGGNFGGGNGSEMFIDDFELVWE